MNEASEGRKRIVECQTRETGDHFHGQIHWKLPERPKRGTTELPDGCKMIYNGDLTVVDKDGDLVSWASSDLLSMMWGDEPDGAESGSNENGK